MREQFSEARRREATAARFWAKVDKSGECWLWLGCKNARGYGVFNISDRARLAHRVAWELMHGPIPKGKCVLHDCPGGDNPACMRHLWLGSRRDNNLDSIRKGTFVYPPGGVVGEGHGCAKLTDSIVIEIRSRYAAGGILYRELAAEFGIHPVTVGDIIRRTTWKHVL